MTDQEPAEHIVFAGNGVLIVERDGTLYTQFDAGYHNTRYIEYAITAEEAARLRRSENQAYLCLIALENSDRPFRDLRDGSHSARQSREAIDDC